MKKSPTSQCSHWVLGCFGVRYQSWRFFLDLGVRLLVFREIRGKLRPIGASQSGVLFIGVYSAANCVREPLAFFNRLPVCFGYLQGTLLFCDRMLHSAVLHCSSTPFRDSLPAPPRSTSLSSTWVNGAVKWCQGVGKSPSVSERSRLCGPKSQSTR